MRTKLKRITVVSVMSALLVASPGNANIVGPSPFRLIGPDAVLKTYNYYTSGEEAPYIRERVETCWNYFVWLNGTYGILPGGDMLCSGDLERGLKCYDVPLYDYNRGGHYCRDRAPLRQLSRSEFVNLDGFHVNSMSFIRCYITESYERPAAETCTP